MEHKIEHKRCDKICICNLLISIYNILPRYCVTNIIRVLSEIMPQ